MANLKYNEALKEASSVLKIASLDKWGKLGIRLFFEILGFSPPPVYVTCQHKETQCTYELLSHCAYVPWVLTVLIGYLPPHSVVGSRNSWGSACKVTVTCLCLNKLLVVC